MNNEYKIRITGVITIVLFAGISAVAVKEKTYFNPKAKPIPAGSKIYIASIPGGFNNYIAAGIIEKKVPVIVVSDRFKADY